jgi:hypothetical protein
MIQSLALPSILVKQETHQTLTTEYAMLGDVVEIAYGNSSVIGTVVEGNPMLDDDGKTWFRVEYTSFGYYGFLTSSAWVTDEVVLRIIQ